MARVGTNCGKPICPYISSTLPDFQVERDLLVTKAFPHLDEICRQRGTYCSPVDLRWDDNQANSGTVFQYCLDHVNRACPFFICILGERYGAFRPKTQKPLPRSYQDLSEDADWLDKSFLVAASGGYKWVLQENYQHYSITELEIVQATQLGEAEHALFYFRQPDHTDLLYRGFPEEERLEKLRVFEAESEYSNLKVRDLKSRIVKRGLPVKYFKTPDELVDIVIKDWIAILDRIVPSLDKSIYVGSEYFSEMASHEAFAETRRREFVRSYEIEEISGQLSDFAEECLSSQNGDDEYSGENVLFKPNNRRRRKEVEVPVEPSIIVLLGDRGSGKTAILANWIKDFAEDHLDIQVAMHHVGASSLSVDVGVLMRNFILHMRGPSDRGLDTTISDTTDASNFYDLSESFRAALGMGPCVLMVDGIDGLSGAYGYTPQQIKELKWLPQPLPPGCRVVLSTVRSDLTFSVLQQRKDTKMICVPNLSDADLRQELLEEHLSVHSESLNDDQLEIITSCKLSEKPIFLSILSSELKVFEVFSKIEHYLDLYLECTSVRDVWSKVIQRWIADYSWNVYNRLGEEENNGKGYSGWVADILRLIAVSRNGLSRTQILSILQQIGYDGDREVQSFHWAQFWSSAQEALYEGASGQICFLHQHFKETVEYKLLGAVTPDQGLMRDPRARNGVTPSHKLSALMSPFLGNSYPETPRNDPNRKAYHQHLADYFMKCPHGRQRSDELPWQLEMCSSMDDLTAVLSEPQLFLDAYGDKWRHEFRHLDLIHYWKVLHAAGYESTAIYKELVESLSREKPIIPSIVIDRVDVDEEEEEEEEKKPEEDAPTLDDQNDLDELFDPSSSMASFPDLYATLPSEDLSQHQQARLCRSIGMFLSEMGHIDDAESVLKIAQEKLFENYPLGDDAQMLLCATEEALGNVYKFKDDNQAAVKWYNKALRSLETLMEGLLEGEITNIHYETKGRILDQLGYIAATEGDYLNAEKLLKEAEKCVLQTGSDDAKATIQYHLGVLRVNRGQFVEAEMLLRQAISTRERWCGKSHLLVAEGLNELAGVLGHPENNISFERYEAEALYRRALEIREECLGSDNLQVAATLFELGKLLKSEHITAPRSECLQLLRRSLDVRTTKLGADDPSTIAVRRVLSSFEASIKPRQQPLTRNSHQRYSKMTWHDAELLMFEQRAKAKSAEAARLKSMSQMAQDRNESRMMGTSTYTPSAPRQSVMERRGSDEDSCSRFGSGDSAFDAFEDEDVGYVYKDECIDDEAEEYVSDFGGRSNGLNFEEPQVEDDNRHGPEDEEVEQGEIKCETGEENEIQGTVMENKESTECELLVVKEGKKKERPRSSYGHRHINTSVHFTDSHPASNEGHPNSRKSSEYMEKISPRLPLLPNSKKPVQAKLVFRISRPRTDPNKLYKRYGNSVGSISDREVSPHRQKQDAIDQSISLIDTKPAGFMRSGRVPSCTRSAPSGIYQIHRSTCHIPGPHTNDIHNSYSLTKGPNSTLISLMGNPPVPRDVFLHIHHTSAWYHVPGRYPTIDSPYPRKRSQRRVICSSRRHLVDAGESSYQEGSSIMERLPSDDQASQNSWDSGRNRIPVGAGDGNMISDWMI